MEASTLSSFRSYASRRGTVLGSYDIEAVRYVMAQMMLWTEFLNTSVVSIGVLIDTGVVVFLEKV